MIRRAIALLASAAGAVSLAACGSSTPAHHASQHGYRTPYGLQAHSPSFGLPPKGLALGEQSSAPTLLMLDSTDTTANSSTWNGITPKVTAGYLPPSSWQTFVPFLSEFPHAIHVAVDVQSFAFGDRRAAISCLDDEPGDAAPSQAGGWVVHEIRAHFRPCVYFSLSQRPAVQSSVNSSLAAAHLHAHVFYWCANWTYAPHLDSGCDATQWTNHYDGRNIDASQVDYAFVGKSTKPSGPVCFGKNWQHTTLCNQVRAQDAARGKLIAREQGYLKVSQQNQAKDTAQLKTVDANLKKEWARFRADLLAHDSSTKVVAELSVSLGNQRHLQGALASIAGRIKVEQTKITVTQAALTASLKKYGGHA